MKNLKMQRLSDVLTQVFPNTPTLRAEIIAGVCTAISRLESLENCSNECIEKEVLEYLDSEIHDWRMELREKRIEANKRRGSDRITANINLAAAILTLTSTGALIYADVISKALT